MSAWVTVLSDCKGSNLRLIDEEDGVPLLSPPTYLEVTSIIHRMKRGKCAGKDRIPIELFKSLPEDLLNDLVSIFQRIWMLNEPRKDWQETVQIPIPKVSRSRNVNDFRRITICQVGYRLYAFWILDIILEELGSYQAAFLRNRSVDDQIVVIKRFLEVEWTAVSMSWRWICPRLSMKLIWRQELGF